MNKKPILLCIGILTILASILACSAPVTTATPIPDDGGSGPGLVTVTELPVLPPPAIAVLRVAYIKGDNIWVWTEGSGSSQLTVAGGASAPVLSSDGLVVAFLRGGELWAVNADGSSERQLVSAAFLSTLVTGSDTAEVNDHVWIPGTHIIGFNTLVVAGEAGYRIPQYDLNSCNADGGTDMIVAMDAPGSGGVPYISPNGSVIALAQPDKIIYLDVSGAFLSVALTFPNVLTYSEWMYVPQLVWLPDSSGVRVVIPASDPLGDPTEVTKVWYVPVSGTAVVLDTFVAAPAFASSPLLSPDTNKVLYMAESGGNYNLQVREVGGLETGYTSGSSGQIGIANWSPDSVRFVYWLPQQSTTYIASVGVVAFGVSDTGSVASSVHWIDDNRVMYIGDGGELRYRSLDGASILINSNVSEYDLGRVIY